MRVDLSRGTTWLHLDTEDAPNPTCITITYTKVLDQFLRHRALADARWLLAKSTGPMRS